MEPLWNFARVRIDVPDSRPKIAKKLFTEFRFWACKILREPIVDSADVERLDDD